MALGMTSKKIIRLFSLEGILTALMAIVAAAVLGVPFFIWFQGVGFDISHLSETGFPVREKIFLDIKMAEVVYSTLVTVGIMVLMSWLPVRKVARLEPTQALRGRAIT